MLKQILVPVADMDDAIAFYTGQLGFALKFRDGSRYAALDTGATTLALVAEQEDVTSGRPGIAIEVADVEETTRTMVAAGAPLILAPQIGPHECRSVVEGAGGLPVVLYAKTGP